MGKISSQESGVVLYSFHVQILLIKLISNLNWKFDQNPNFQSRLPSTRPYKSRIGNKHGENMVLKRRE